jgi:anti-sigma B factor antagonist
VFSTLVNIRDCGDHLVVTLRGELDLADAAAVTAALVAAADRVPAVVVDLAGLEFIDACGLSAVARARKHARKAGGDLVLAAPRRQVQRILAIPALACYGFSVYDSVPEAGRSFRRSPAAGVPVAHVRDTEQVS